MAPPIEPEHNQEFEGIKFDSVLQTLSQMCPPFARDPHSSLALSTKNRCTKYKSSAEYQSGAW